MKYGLKDKTIVALQQILSTNKNIDEAVLFGSRAKGSFQAGSDVDITLKGKGLTLTDISDIKTQLDDLLLPVIFDISIYEHIDNLDLLDHIQRVGSCIYTKRDTIIP